MKIIISPSKTQSNQIIRNDLNRPLFYSSTKQIIREIKMYKKDELSQIMHIKGKLLDETYLLYKTMLVNDNNSTPAIQLYTGVVYESFDINEYDEKELAYLNKNVRIISAMYGVLNPMDGIKPYRLDFTMKLRNINLNAFWKEKILNSFSKEELILDCASLEFSHFFFFFKERVHRVEFIDVVDGKEKIISYNAKKLRGMMVNYCIKNNVSSINQIREFTQEGYFFQADKSDETISVFIRLKTSAQE